MSILKRLIKRGNKNDDPYKSAPAFKQMMLELEKEENEFIERLEKILPIITYNVPADDVPKLPESLQALAFPINFDDELSINLAIFQEKHYDILLQRHIEVAKDKVTPDKLVSKAFGNLFKLIEDTISVTMISEDMGMLTGCNGLESSLVLVNEIWELIRTSVGGDKIVFGIPARDIFIFAAADKCEAVGQLDVKVKEYFNDQAHPVKISRRLYAKHKDGESEIFRE
jgi:hypothetical protein